jgi:hypothetical protein
MQPTSEQVRRSMQALQAPQPVSEPVTGDATVPDAAVDRMARMPAVRADRVAQARAFLDSGDELTSEELADKVVGRLVCDRLR